MLAPAGGGAATAPLSAAAAPPPAPAGPSVDAAAAPLVAAAPPSGPVAAFPAASVAFPPAVLSVSGSGGPSGRGSGAAAPMTPTAATAAHATRACLCSTKAASRDVASQRNDASASDATTSTPPAGMASCAVTNPASSAAPTARLNSLGPAHPASREGSDASAVCSRVLARGVGPREAASARDSQSMRWASSLHRAAPRARRRRGDSAAATREHSAVAIPPGGEGTLSIPPGGEGAVSMPAGRDAFISPATAPCTSPCICSAAARTSDASSCGENKHRPISAKSCCAPEEPSPASSSASMRDRCMPGADSGVTWGCIARASTPRQSHR